MIRDDAVYLRHIRDAINRIEDYVAGLDNDAFMNSNLIQDAVIRQFEIVGEATRISLLCLRSDIRSTLEGYCRHA